MSEQETLHSSRTANLSPLSQMPVHCNKNGAFPAAPVLYARQLHRIADLLDELAAIEADDPAGEVAAFSLGGATLPLYDTEVCADEDGEDNPIPVGWIHQYDDACWVFVPALSDSDLDFLVAAREKRPEIHRETS